MDDESRTRQKVVDLSHPLQAGRRTYDWMPAQEVSELLSRSDSRDRYTNGVEFVIHHVAFPGNSGTYMDSPFHRYENGADLAALPLHRLVNLPGVVIDVPNNIGEIGVDRLTAVRDRLPGAAVLFRTGQEHKWNDPDYAVGAPYLGEQSARMLAELGAAIVGIDALNLDNLDDLSRPAHSILLKAGIPIVENLCRLEHLTDQVFWFTAAPVGVEECSSFPVRAFATLRDVTGPSTSDDLF